MFLGFGMMYGSNFDSKQESRITASVRNHGARAARSMMLVRAGRDFVEGRERAMRDYSNAKIRFQSFFMLITTQPSRVASS